MTVRYEFEDVAIMVCDRCGEEVEWDDTQTSDRSVLEELHRIGWVTDKPEIVAVRHNWLKPFKVKYADHFCPDCKGPHVSSRRFRATPPPRLSVGLIDDPCDEWDRRAVFEAVGLRGDCGHPTKPIICPMCEAGFPIGECRPAWRR